MAQSMNSLRDEYQGRYVVQPEKPNRVPTLLLVGSSLLILAGIIWALSDMGGDILVGNTPTTTISQGDRR